MSDKTGVTLPALAASHVAVNQQVSLVLDAAAAEAAGVGDGNGAVVDMGDKEEEGSGSRRMLIVVTTTRSDGGVRQRCNAALAHVEKHRLFSVVHFAHASGVYDAYFFDEIRQIERCHGR
uniref:Glycosyltransferases n=1 Tax=Oryza nivara TaxID=4536 RepID=A0A0E0H7H0_ORYNI